MSAEHNRELLERISPDVARYITLSPGIGNALLKIGADKLFRFVAKLQIDWGNNEAVLREYMRQGFGVLGIHNHPTQMDGISMVRFAIRLDPRMNAHFPIALHQWYKQAQLLSLLDQLFANTTYPVTTPHTMKLQKEAREHLELSDTISMQLRKLPDLTLNAGYETFAQGVSWALSNGEFAGLALDAERTPEIGSADRKTVGLLLQQLDIMSTPQNFIILPIAIDVNFLKGYDSGYNKRRPVTLHIGSPLERTQLSQLTTRAGDLAAQQKRNVYRRIDEELREQIQKLLKPVSL